MEREERDHSTLTLEILERLEAAVDGLLRRLVEDDSCEPRLAREVVREALERLLQEPLFSSRVMPCPACGGMGGLLLRDHDLEDVTGLVDEGVRQLRATLDDCFEALGRRGHGRELAADTANEAMELLMGADLFRERHITCLYCSGSGEDAATDDDMLHALPGGESKTDEGSLPVSVIHEKS